jgi:plastocyanin
MRQALLILVAIVTVVLGGVAAAATVTVTITKAGYVPKSITIAQGDTVQFTNGDTIAHEITFKTTTGVTCSPNPLVLQPAQTGTCTLQSAGSLTYSDPNVKGNTFRGTITVTGAAATLSLAAATNVVAYGGKVTLSGALSTHQSGENVDVLAQACGAQAPTKTTTVQTTANGAFTAVAQPLMNTTYTVKARSATSNTAVVSVRPMLRLARVAPHRYSLRVSAAQGLAGKYASFQRYTGTRWLVVKSVLLRASTTAVAPTVLSTASFRSTVKARTRVRAVITQAQVGACYLPGTSNTISS